MVRGLLIFSILILLGGVAFSQNKETALVKGRLVFDKTQRSVPQVQVALVRQKLLTYTNEDGEFVFSNVPLGNYSMVVSGSGIKTDTIVIAVNSNPSLLGDLEVEEGGQTLSMQTLDIPSIALGDNNFSQDDDGGSNTATSGLLTASRDPFLNTAAFVFGAYRFQPRGYDRNSQLIQINGVEMNDVETGDAYWSQWGGLNDVFRNRNNIYGLQASGYTFGHLNGSVFFDITAANQRKQTRITYSASNRQYRNRVMLTHSSGLNKKGWAYSLSASKRWAKEGYIPGTFYNSYSYYLGLSKKINNKGVLSFSTFGAPIERGKMAPAIQEAYDLAGSNFYNPNWGYQNGEIRNAKVHKNFQPVFLLNYEHTPNHSTRWNTVVGYQFGKMGNSTLDWFNGRDPRPDYYRKLPSYYLLNDPPDPYLAQIAESGFRNNLQLNWDEMIESNRINRVAVLGSDGLPTGDSALQSVYVVGQDVDQIKKWSFNTNFEKVLNPHIKMTVGLSAIGQQTQSYRELLDLLGGEFYVNKNQFAQLDFSGSGYSVDNNLDAPNQRVYVGDKYYYNYINQFFKARLWGQANFTYNKADFFIAGNVGTNSFSREGLFRNGLFPNGNESFGLSKKNNFTLYGIKGGITYKLDGRNFLFVNAGLMQDAPTVDNTFISPRTRNFTVAHPTEQKTSSVEGGFMHRSPKLNGRLVGYATDIKDITEIKRFYNEGNGANTFTNYVLSGLNIRYTGLEMALEYKLHSSLSLTGVVALGQAFYTNNPEVSIYKDNFVDTTGQGGFAGTEKTYIKNYYLASGPQSAYTLGVNYRSKKYWYANVNFNYFDRSFIDIAPNRRTEATLDLIEPGSAEWHSIVDQEKLPSFFSINLFAGKSWLLSRQFKKLKRNTFLFLNVGINNVLNNTNIRTGGFENLRFDADGRVAGKFPNKYFYSYGRNFFVNLSLKF